MLNIAYIGFGRSVTEYHLPYLLNRPNFNIKWIYRREEDRVLDMDIEKKYPELQFTTDINDLVKDPHLQLVVICSPNSSHVEYSKLFLNNGKNVLVEKPFAETMEQAHEVIALAKEKNLVVMTNQNRRFDGDCQTVKKVLESGKLGEIVDVESHYNYFRPEPDEPIENVRMGFLYGLAVHTIDQAIYLFGNPDRIDYDVRSIGSPGKADNYVDLFMFYGKTKVRVKCSLYTKIEYPRFIMHGKKGSFVKPAAPHQSSLVKTLPYVVTFKPEAEQHFGQLSYVNEKGETVNETVESIATDYGKLYDGLYDSIVNNVPKPICDEQILQVMEILLRGIEVALEAK